MANKYRFFAYFDFVFYEPLKHDTYSPYISLIICIIFYYPLAIVWAITFENPSINEEMAAIWNFYVFPIDHSAFTFPYTRNANQRHFIIDEFPKVIAQKKAVVK